MWPGRGIYIVQKNISVGATSCRGEVYLCRHWIFWWNDTVRTKVVFQCLRQQSWIKKTKNKKAYHDLKDYICSAFATEGSLCSKSRFCSLKPEQNFSNYHRLPCCWNKRANTILSSLLWFELAFQPCITDTQFRDWLKFKCMQNKTNKTEINRWWKLSHMRKGHRCICVLIILY